MKFLLVLIALFTFTPVSASVDDFEFRSFKGEYILSKDESSHSVLEVEETLVAEFPTFNQNHGIERAIPLTYKDADLELEIKYVTDGNIPLQYTTYKSSGHLVLRIGDPFSFVHGQQTYVIGYEVHNVINFLDSHDEFYWDINGTSWLQPFDIVEATISFEEVQPQNRLLCYTGGFGSKESNCSIQMEGNTVKARASDLDPNENLSVAIAFDKGIFAKDQWYTVRNYARYVIAAGIPLVVLGAMVGLWVKRGRDPEGRGVIFPQNEPPTLDVVTSGIILDEKLEMRTLTAQILELAISGYIVIHQNGKDYELELVKNASRLSKAKTSVIEMLFSSSSAVGETVNIKDKKHELYKDYRQVSKEQLKLASKKYFTSNPSTQLTKYLLLGGLTLFIGFFVFSANTWWSVSLAIATILSGVIIMSFAKAMPSRTLEGVKQREYLLGLKEYISLAEKDRIKFHQSPKGLKHLNGKYTSKKAKLHLFESLLPYAVIFKQEKDWAKEFKGLYTQSPSWYDGSDFNTIGIASALGSMNTQVNKAFTPASSSGSSGGSGFSGGFSGGGGGGGGGGGW